MKNNITRIFICIFALTAALTLLNKPAFCVTGIELSLGWQQMDATSNASALKYGAANYPDYSVDNNDQNKHAGFFLFAESNAKHRMGIRAGIDKYLNMHFKEYSDIGKADSKITYFAIPVTVYYKYKSTTLYSVWVGAGIEWMKGNFYMPDAPAYGYTKQSFSETRVLPHIGAGLELFFSKHVSIGFNAMYVFNAKFDNFTNAQNGQTHRLYTDNGKITAAPAGAGLTHYSINYSGFKTEFALRIYLNPPF